MVNLHLDRRKGTKKETHGNISIDRTDTIFYILSGSVNLLPSDAWFCFQQRQLSQYLHTLIQSIKPDLPNNFLRQLWITPDTYLPRLKVYPSANERINNNENVPAQTNGQPAVTMEAKAKLETSHCLVMGGGGGWVYVVGEKSKIVQGKGMTAKLPAWNQCLSQLNEEVLKTNKEKGAQGIQ